MRSDNQACALQIANSRESKSGGIWQGHFVSGRQYIGLCLWRGLKFHPHAEHLKTFAINVDIPERYDHIVYRQRTVVRQIENSSHWTGALQ